VAGRPDQISREFKLQNQGAINLCKAMIEKGIFAEENEVNDNGAG
jgi:hypothetical protein